MNSREASFEQIWVWFIIGYAHIVFPDTTEEDDVLDEMREPTQLPALVTYRRRKNEGTTTFERRRG